MYFRFLLCLVLLFVLRNSGGAQPRTDTFLVQLLKGDTGALRPVLNDPQTYRCQIIYTRIDRDKANKPSFTSYFFNYDPHLYFNPASTVKLPLALLSLEKLNVLSVRGVNKYTTIQFDSSHTGQRALYRDTTAATGRPTIAHFIKRALLVSENDPYNRLYQWMGQGPIHQILNKKGYRDVRIVRQFQPLSAEQNRYTNAISFLDAAGKTIYRQPPAYNSDTLAALPPILLGAAHYNRNDSLVKAPMDFSGHNKLSLLDLHQMLQSVLFPSSVPRGQQFRLTKNDYRFLYRWLSQYPSETDDPKYDTSKFYDSYVKFFFRDSTRRMPPSVRVFNKVGWAYGFLTDVSYVADFERGLEYMLSATVYVNSDGILNDGRYDYLTIGYPFLYQLGQKIYQYELGRKRAVRPDLSRFRVSYDKRDTADRRPSLKDIDN